ncbi:hypothetical protein RQP46_009459 [Phenoliferia psychrophenolica]
MSFGPRLSGKVAIITGGSSGMGRATTDLFHKHEAQIVVFDRQAPLAKLPEGVVFFQGSVTSTEDWSAVLALAEKTFGVPTILINCAGVLSEAKMPDITDDEWDRVTSINSTAMAGIRTMGIGSGIAYESAKASCCHMTKVAARDHGRAGIRVNAVLPGFTLTEMVVKGVAGRDTAHYSSMVDGHLPMAATLGTKSEESSYVTGLMLVHDGGFTLC